MADDMRPQGGKRVIVNPWTWQDRFAFVHANVISDGRRVAYCAGQTSTDADGNAIHKDDMAGQIEQALANVETVLGEAGMALADVVRLNYYVTDLSVPPSRRNAQIGPGRRRVPAGLDAPWRHSPRVPRLPRRDRGD